jgi:uncharacterized protein
LGSQGTAAAGLRISLLPTDDWGSVPPPLLDIGTETGGDSSLEPIQLLEGYEYRYEVEMGDRNGKLSIDRPEIFLPDDERGAAGRLRPGLHTGRVSARVFCDSVELGSASFEVRSRKLDYLRHYRWMLAAVASFSAEVLLSQFAVSAQRFTPGAAGDPKTLYQRFAFLHALLTTESFTAAAHQVLSRPYEAWLEEEVSRRPSQGVRASGRVAAGLARPGERVAWGHGKVLNTLPRIIYELRTQATLDNAPNRFVKFALTRWRDTVEQVRAAAESAQGPTASRGALEARELSAVLDAILGEELFREVGELLHFPSSNQVLQKREGYRDMFRAYVQFEVAASLAWAGGEDVFGGGQKNVAALYEYWVFLELAQLLASLCSAPFDWASLFSASEDGLQLEITRGRQRVLSGAAERLGRRLEVELWYNRLFPRAGGQGGSWSQAMRPDYSVKIQPDPGNLEFCPPVWVHFDAKYRVDYLTELFGVDTDEDAPGDDSSELPDASLTHGRAKRNDLLKMHAYRDAIRRSAGAYVIYPGNEMRAMRAFHEILPGLGAFVLRPLSGDVAEGRGELGRFLNDVLEHTALQVSQHERGRFWEQRIYGAPLRTTSRPGAVRFLKEPAADTKVLVGYVRSSAHLEWIHTTKLYNLRADGRPGTIEGAALVASLLVLWGKPLGAELEVWLLRNSTQLMSRDELAGLGYPAPSGHMYHCLALLQRTELPAGVVRLDRVLRAQPAPGSAAPFGAPFVTTWQALVSEP